MPYVLDELEQGLGIDCLAVFLHRVVDDAIKGSAEPIGDHGVRCIHRRQQFRQYRRTAPNQSVPCRASRGGMSPFLADRTERLQQSLLGSGRVQDEQKHERDNRTAIHGVYPGEATSLAGKELIVDDGWTPGKCRLPSPIYEPAVQRFAPSQYSVKSF